MDFAHSVICRSFEKRWAQEQMGWLGVERSRNGAPTRERVKPRLIFISRGNHCSRFAIESLAIGMNLNLDVLERQVRRRVMSLQMNRSRTRYVPRFAIVISRYRPRISEIAGLEPVDPYRRVIIGNHDGLLKPLPIG